MDLYSIITAVLLLQLQGFHVALLQAPTDSPGQTIDQSWLRQLVKSKLNKTTSQAQSNDIVDMTMEGTESTDDSEGVIANGSVSFSGEQDNVQDTNETSGGVTIGTTMPPGLPNATAEEPPETTVAPEPPVSVALNSSQVSNATGEDSGFQNATTTAITENSNGSNSMSNYTELNETTTAPDTNSTEQIGPDHPGAENRVTNSTEDFHNVTTAVPEPSSEPSTASPSTKLPLDSPGTTTAKITPETTTTTGPSTITAMMKTGAASGSNSARGEETVLQCLNIWYIICLEGTAVCACNLLTCLFK